MIADAGLCQIKPLHAQQGLRPAQIAAPLSRAPRTVAYGLTPERFRPRQARPRASQLAPLKAQIVRMLAAYPSSAAQVLQRVREHGFAGGSSLGKASVRTVRPKRQAAFLTRACAPGACAQVEWGSFGPVPGGPTSRRLSFLVMGLCYRRMRYVECTVSQPMAHFLACHHHAFACVGGMPHQGMVDNLKSAVLKRARGEAPVFHPKSLDFAPPNGLTIPPCNVGKGYAKGRVANGGGYVQQIFLAGLQLPAFRALNPAARQWLDPVANGRLHGATRDHPTQVWHKERPSLRPRPLHPLDMATVAQVRASRQWRLPLDTNRDAVPAHYAGQALTRKTSPDRLCLSPGDTLIARHARGDDRCQEGEAPDPPKPLLEQRKKARAPQRFRRFLALSPRAEAYYLTREERRMKPPHHVRQIVAWRDRYSPEAVARALEAALVYAAFASEQIANLLEQRVRFTPEARARHLTRSAALLAVRLEPPDLSRYHATPQRAIHAPEEGQHHD